MARHPSHAKPKKKHYFLRFLIVILILAMLSLAASNVDIFSEPLKELPVVGTFVEALDFSATNETPEQNVVSDLEDELSSDDAPLSKTLRLYFNSENTNSGAPAYVIRDGVSPRRLEFTLYNVRELDMDSIAQTFSEHDFVKDVYRTIVLDDSMRCFTVELSKDVSYVASEYNTDGYIDLTLTETGSDSDDILYIVRSASGKMNEDMAALCESVSDFSPSIVKTKAEKYCVVAGACSTEDEAKDILEYLDDDFYIEECSVFSNPE